MTKSKSVIGIVQTLFAAAVVLMVLSTYFSGEANSTHLVSEHEGTYTLNLLGYNYTKYDIQEYSVNGQPGGHVSVSGPTSGGSGIVCCIQLPKSYKNISLYIRWQVGGCVYTAKDPFSKATQKLYHYYYREAKVKVPRPDGMRPAHLETHFYPDGSVQARITEDLSLPHLRLDDSRRKNFQYPQCKDDKKPE